MIRHISLIGIFLGCLILVSCSSSRNLSTQARETDDLYFSSKDAAYELSQEKATKAAAPSVSNENSTSQGSETIKVFTPQDNPSASANDYSSDNSPYNPGFNYYQGATMPFYSFHVSPLSYRWVGYRCYFYPNSYFNDPFYSYYDPYGYNYNSFGDPWYNPYGYPYNPYNCYNPYAWNGWNPYNAYNPYNSYNPYNPYWWSVHHNKWVGNDKGVFSHHMPRMTLGGNSTQVSQPNSQIRRTITPQADISSTTTNTAAHTSTQQTTKAGGMGNTVSNIIYTPATNANPKKVVVFDGHATSSQGTSTQSTTSTSGNSGTSIPTSSVGNSQSSQVPSTNNTSGTTVPEPARSKSAGKWWSVENSGTPSSDNTNGNNNNNQPAPSNNNRRNTNWWSSDNESAPANQGGNASPRQNDTPPPPSGGNRGRNPEGGGATHQRR